MCVLSAVHFRVVLVLFSSFLNLVQTSSNTALDTSSKGLIIVNLCYKIKFIRSAKRTCQLHAIPLTLPQSESRHRPYAQMQFHLAIANGNAQILNNIHHPRTRNVYALESYWWPALRNYAWQQIMRNTAEALLYGLHVFVSVC